MFYNFINEPISEGLKEDVLEAMKEFFSKLEKIKEAYKISSIRIVESHETALAFFLNRENVIDSCECFKNREK